jgi:hypothetical protein
MDRKKRKREVYKHTASVEEPSAAGASGQRVHTEHHPAPPRSPEKRRDYDDFDILMGFPEDNDGVGGPIMIEGPAALKIKVKKKAKRYENSVSVFYVILYFSWDSDTDRLQDHPVKTWIPERDNYLDGLLQLKGCGAWWSNGCVVCKHLNPTWRCEDCFGNRLLCGACVVEKHRDEPLHFLEVSSNVIFENFTD